jgi:hypothetical protein
VALGWRRDTRVVHNITALAAQLRHYLAEGDNRLACHRFPVIVPRYCASPTGGCVMLSASNFG